MTKEELRNSKPEEYCRMRHIAYGMLACHNCPESCAVKENNLNILANIESVWIEESDKPYGSNG